MVAGLVFLFVLTVALIFGYSTIMGKGKSRKLLPHEVDWGDGKDLSYFLDLKPFDKRSELEQWYMDNVSKDAEISRLKNLVESKSSLISRLNQENDQTFIRESLPRTSSPMLPLSKPKSPKEQLRELDLYKGSKHQVVWLPDDVDVYRNVLYDLSNQQLDEVEDIW